MISYIAGNRLLHEFLAAVTRADVADVVPSAVQVRDFDANRGKHTSLIDAIREQDAERARVAMRDHIESLRARVLTGGAVFSMARSRDCHIRHQGGKAWLGR